MRLHRQMPLMFLMVMALMMCISVIMTSCERRTLEVVVNNTIRTKVVVNWHTRISAEVSIEDSIALSNYYGGIPNGMTLMLWGQNTGRKYVETTNNNVIDVPLEPDTYQLIIFNDREDEYLPYMRLYDKDSFDNIAMRLERYTPSRAYGCSEYLYYPDPIGVAVDTFQISEQMLQDDTTIFVPYDQYIKYGPGKIIERESKITLNEVAMPMTITFHLKLKVKHRHSLKTIEACLSGMADGFYLSRIERTRESGAIEMDYKKWEYYAVGNEADSVGVVVNKTASFGLPYGKELLAERDSTDNVLHVRVTLTNNTVQEFSFNVGKQLRYVTSEGSEAQVRTRDDLRDLELELDLRDVIVLPYIPSSSKTGFDAEVAEWDDGGTIDIGGF